MIGTYYHLLAICEGGRLHHNCKSRQDQLGPPRCYGTYFEVFLDMQCNPGTGVTSHSQYWMTSLHASGKLPTSRVSTVNVYGVFIHDRDCTNWNLLCSAA